MGARGAVSQQSRSVLHRELVAVATADRMRTWWEREIAAVRRLGYPATMMDQFALPSNSYPKWENKP